MVILSRGQRDSGIKGSLVRTDWRHRTHPKLASCQVVTNKSAVRQSSLVGGERYAAPASAKMCMADGSALGG
jgi:hypothetical protein